MPSFAPQNDGQDQESSLTRIIRRNGVAKYADIIVAVILLGIAWYLNSAQSLILSGISALLISGRYILMAFFEEKLLPIYTSISEIGNFIDISGKGNVGDLDVLIRSYASIVDYEFLAVKDAIVSEAVERLRKIAIEKTSEELSRGDYYQWLLPILENVKPNEVVRAVSMMSDVEWDDSPEEKRFFDGNLKAAVQGALVERIFVISEAKLVHFRGIKEVARHDASVEPKRLRGYYIELEKLQKRDVSLLEAVGHGFIDFDGRVALIDNFSPTGEVRGRVSKNPAELKRIREIFAKLKNMANEMM